MTNVKVQPAIDI